MNNNRITGGKSFELPTELGDLVLLLLMSWITVFMSVVSSKLLKRYLKKIDRGFEQLGKLLAKLNKYFN
jgi:hypothetical protein